MDDQLKNIYWCYLRNLYLEKIQYEMYSGHPICDLIVVSAVLLSNPTPHLVTIYCIHHLQSPVVTFVTQWYHVTEFVFMSSSGRCHRSVVKWRWASFTLNIPTREQQVWWLYVLGTFLSNYLILQQTDDNFERSWRRLEKIDIKIHSSQCFYNIGMKKMFYLLKLWRFC